MRVDCWLSVLGSGLLVVVVVAAVVVVGVAVVLTIIIVFGLVFVVSGRIIILVLALVFCYCCVGGGGVSLVVVVIDLSNVYKIRDHLWDPTEVAKSSRQLVVNYVQLSQSDASGQFLRVQPTPHMMQ